VPADAARIGEGDDCIQIGGHVRLDPASGGLLADVLPPLINVHAAPRRSCNDFSTKLSASGRLRGSLASAQLAQLMFVQILRAHLETSGRLVASMTAAAQPEAHPTPLTTSTGVIFKPSRLERLAAPIPTAPVPATAADQGKVVDVPVRT